MTRALSAFALAIPVLLIIWYGPPTLFVGIAFLVILLAAWEFHGLIEACNWGGIRWEGALDVGAFFLAVWIGGMLPGLILTLIVLRLLVRGMTYGNHRNGLAGAGVSLLGVLWIGGAGALIGALILLPSGREAILFLLVVVWANDIMALYIGRSIGIRRLAPAISPGKSVEGAIGGLIAGGVAGWILANWFEIPGLDRIWAIPIALFMGVLSQLGDLCESFLKRAAGQKDSGSLIPGHGGVLDRIDGLLLTGPPFYYFLRWAVTIN